MWSKSESAALIETRLGALAAALYAAIVGASRIASVIARGDARLKGIHLLAEILPPFTQVVVFFFIYGLVVWRFVDVLREFVGAERVYFGLFFFDLLLYPFRVFIPAVGAMCVLVVQALANLVMFQAPSGCCFTLGAQSRTPTHPSRKNKGAARVGHPGPSSLKCCSPCPLVPCFHTLIHFRNCRWAGFSTKYRASNAMAMRMT